MQTVENTAAKVWVVDDDASVRWVLEKALQHDGMQVRGFAEAEAVQLALQREQPDVLVTDIRMPGISGIELLQYLESLRPALPVIVITAHSDLDSAVTAYHSGAFEYLPKPFDVDEAVTLVRRAARVAGPQAAAVDMVQGVSPILGQAPAMQEVFRSIGRLSRSSMTVLITGESGTGKELVARELHRHSPRADAPFVALNTTAIAADLLESELFGHERGAFTGAERRRIGRFEQADNGTLFLDEIGDMSAALQTRLLRVLQSFDWPGNVRQLINTARRFTVIAPGSEIGADDVPAELGGQRSSGRADPEWVSALSRWAAQQLDVHADQPLLGAALPEFEKALIQAALQRTHGRRQEAAQLLG